MSLGEQRATTDARTARMKSQFPVIFGTNDIKTGVQVDGFTVNNGGAPSDFAQIAMRLAAQGGNDTPKNPDRKPTFNDNHVDVSGVEDRRGRLVRTEAPGMTVNDDDNPTFGSGVDY